MRAGCCGRFHSAAYGEAIGCVKGSMAGVAAYAVNGSAMTASAMLSRDLGRQKGGMRLQ